MYRLKLLLVVTLFILPAKGQEVTHEHSVHHAFIENKGQWAEHVLFKNKIDGGNMWVEQGRVLFQLQDFTMLQAAHLGKSKIEENLTYREKLVELEFVDALKVNQIE